MGERNIMSPFERKFGKYAIKNLSFILVFCYGVGYLLQLMDRSNILISFLTLNPYAILHGQVWRLVTWILIPPPGSGGLFLTLIMLVFYCSIGTSLERTWGTYRYNVYLFQGMLFTILGSFLLMGYCYLFQGEMIAYNTPEVFFAYISPVFSTYYINMSIFLGFAVTFPEVQVLLMFIIPIKVKWMGIAYGILLLVDLIQSPIIGRIVIGTSLLNFVVFFLMTRSAQIGMRISPRQVKRRRDFNRETRKARPVSISKHKCAICGKNSEDNPEAEFRFCSKCNGNYEYCQDHLFTHTHVK